MWEWGHLARASTGIKSTLSLNEERLHDPDPGHETVDVYVQGVVDGLEELALHGVDPLEGHTTDGGPGFVRVRVTRVSLSAKTEPNGLNPYTDSSMNLFASMRAMIDTVYSLPCPTFAVARELGAFTGPMLASSLPAAPAMTGRLSNQR
jgi:hypothetical protein